VVSDPGPVEEMQGQIDLARDELSDLAGFLKWWRARIIEGHAKTIKHPDWIGVAGMQRHVATALEHLGGHPYPKGEANRD
jgi:hypothetical protein